MTDHPSFWTVADERTRYGEYIRLGSFEPFDGAGTPAELAEFAWRRGTGPVMSPPYVRRHPRILSARVNRTGWDGSLLAQVELITSAPRHLMGTPLPPDHHGHDGYWRDWPYDWSFASDRELFRDPSEEDLANGARHMLGTLTLQFRLASELPEPSPGGADLETCAEAIAELVAGLNEIVGPVIARIEGGTNGE
jgi:hypothetical protein